MTNYTQSTSSAQTTGQKVLAKLASLPNMNVEDKGEGRYRLSGTPWRNGSDSKALALEIAPDGEHGKWFDHRDKEGGSLYDFAVRIDVQIPSSEPEATFDYYNEHGELVMQVVRSPGKKFWQRQPDGAGGWINSTTKPKIRRPPYRLADIMAHPDSIIFVVEGEKDADTAKRMGILATCNPGGAKNWKTIYPDYLVCFNKRHVVIIPDNDESGIEHVHDVAMRLNGTAASIKIMAPLGESKGYDLTDWANDGGTSGKLYDSAKNTPEYEPSFKDRATRMKEAGLDSPPPVLTLQGIREAKTLKTLSADEILNTDWPDPIWAIPLLLPVGLTILAGKPKLGKSWLGLQIAKEVANGGEVLGQLLDQPLSVLYLALEDTPRRLKQRMKKQGWSNGIAVDFITMNEFKDMMGSFLHGGAERLAQQIATKNYDLTIVDTLSRACFDDQNKNEVMASLLAPVQEFANSENKAILLMDHHSSHLGSGIMDAIGNIMGGTQKGATLDTAWGLYRERGKQDANLAITGRDVDEQNLSLYFNKESGLWKFQGDYHALKLTAKRQEYLALINELDGSAQAPEIAKNLGITVQAARQQLEELVTGGHLTRTAKGRFVFYELPTI